MIDTHCHLEQPDYDKDREAVIEKCKKGLDAVITCAPDPKHYNLSFELIKSHPKFVFMVAGIHPQYVNRFTEEQVAEAMRVIEDRRDMIVGIGETGLDYSFVTDEKGRRNQRNMFSDFIRLAKRLDLPVVVHIRNGKDGEDAFEHAIEILEKEKAKRVQLHMFGSRALLKRALNNGFYVSANAIILRSKSYKKVVRDTPLDRLMLETDSPWLHPSGKSKHEQRNDPTFVRAVAEKVAEIKAKSIKEIDSATTENATRFFNLNIIQA
jgi:TatD DNase family protein